MFISGYMIAYNGLPLGSKPGWGNIGNLELYKVEKDRKGGRRWSC